MPAGVGGPESSLGIVASLTSSRCSSRGAPSLQHIKYKFHQKRHKRGRNVTCSRFDKTHARVGTNIEPIWNQGTQAKYKRVLKSICPRIKKSRRTRQRTLSNTHAHIHTHTHTYCNNQLYTPACMHEHVPPNTSCDEGMEIRTRIPW